MACQLFGMKGTRAGGEVFYSAFADDKVLLASLDCACWYPQGQFAAACVLFSAGEQWTARSRFGVSSWPKQRRLSLLGSCSQVTVRWSMRKTDCHGISSKVGIIPDERYLEIRE